MTRYLEQGLFILFMLLVVLAPLPLGSNREWSWSLCAFLFSEVALLWALLAALDRDEISTKLNPMLIIGFLLVCAWALLQTADFLPKNWHHPLWELSATTLAANSTESTIATSSISLAPDSSYTAVMRLLCYGLVFFLAFQWGRDRLRAHRALQWLVLAGLFYAIYGLAVFWSGSSTLFWFEDAGYKQDLRSTFVNRNHYATYAGMTLLCAIALFYQRVAVHSRPSRPKPSHVRLPPGAHVATQSERLERFALEVWKPLIVMLLLTTSLILTHSRGGFISTAVAGFVLLLCFNHRRRIQSRRSKLAIGMAVGIAVIAFWLTSEVLLKRIDQTEFDDNLRFVAYELISESTRDNPVLGFGYGTFADSFRLYRSDTIDAYLDRAHNTYLENAFELGWPAALLLFGVIAALFFTCLRGLRKRGRDWIYPATGIAATVLVAIHSFFDFSLQIPAVAIVYACIMGMACAQSYSSAGRNR